MTAPGQALRMKGYVTGLDGRAYRGRSLTAPERQVLIGEAHELRHQGLTLRQVMTELVGYGHRTSLGAVHGYLADFVCDDCSSVQVRQNGHLNSSSAVAR